MKLVITQPDDWHCHFRDNVYLSTTVPASAKNFARAIAMPNLKDPVVTVSHAHEYRQRILSAVPKGLSFEPLMTLYLTDHTHVQTIIDAKSSSFIKACKLYPAGATTHSARGVTNIENIYDVLHSMEEHQLPLLIHGEVTHNDVDIFDREKIFIDKVLSPLQRKFNKLPIVLEHITTKEAIDWVTSTPKHIAATITPHHLFYNRNALLQGGIRPDFYCLPILKRKNHQDELIKAATSGDPKFFIGTDSAPHGQSHKYNACGCAGIFNAHIAIELYASIFEQQQCLNRLEDFVSHFGADFYKLPRNTNQLVLEKNSWQAPTDFIYGNEKLTPMCAGENIEWQVKAIITNDKLS